MGLCLKPLVLSESWFLFSFHMCNPSICKCKVKPKKKKIHRCVSSSYWCAWIVNIGGAGAGDDVASWQLGVVLGVVVIAVAMLSEGLGLINLNFNNKKSTHLRNSLM